MEKKYSARRAHHTHHARPWFLRLQVNLFFPDLMCLPFHELLGLPSLICMRLPERPILKGWRYAGVRTALTVRTGFSSSKIRASQSSIIFYYKVSHNNLMQGITFLSSWLTYGYIDCSSPVYYFNNLTSCI
jgi:hypothetical protein